MIELKRIRSFWRWFESHSVEIAHHLTNDARTNEVVLKLGKQISQLDEGLAWEVGPGLEKEFALVLSPNGSREKLLMTGAIISYAPTIPSWEFHEAKPPKHWDLSFEMSNRKGQTVQIDAKSWKYALVSYNEGEFYDITLIARNLPSLDTLARIQAAHIVLEGILGERMFLEKIGRVDVVMGAKPETEDVLSDIHVLGDHLKYLSSKDAPP